MKKIVFIAFFLFVAESYATITYLAVNHITKQLYWAESDTSEEGFIGWEIIPEAKMHSLEKKYMEEGYTFTEFPYLIETILIIVLVLISLLVVFLKKRRNIIIKK